MDDKAIIIFKHYNKNISFDLEISLDITANELVIALNDAFHLKIDVDNVFHNYLKSENPIALIRGNKTLKDFGIRNGSVINFTE